METADQQIPEVTIVANDIGPVGGMERQLTELISGLLAAGICVTVISWTCSLPPHRNLRWIRVPGPSRPFALGYPWFLLLASLMLLFYRRGVVHSSGAIVFARRSIYTVHFCHQAMAELLSFSRASRPGLAHRVNAWASGAMSRLTERLCYRPKRAERLVGVSKGVCVELEQYFPSMRSKTIVIPNGVDTDVFHPATSLERRSQSSEITAIFVGGEWERKGLGIAIESLAGTTGISLLVVGAGDTDTFARLASGLGLDGRVEFVGVTADVASIYRSADVFVLPTAYETFSLATYEAAASGLPLLVTRVNGVEDLLRDGENGWFIERDAGQIRRHLCELQRDPKLRARLGTKAREDSLEFSWSRVVKQYKQLYVEVGA